MLSQDDSQCHCDGIQVYVGSHGTIGIVSSVPKLLFQVEELRCVFACRATIEESMQSGAKRNLLAC